MTKSPSIAIIGAGLTGLTAAYRLKKAGYAVSVYEASDTPGGLAKGFKPDGYDWYLDYFYHHIFSSDTEILGFFKELGLEKLLIAKKPTTAMMFQGKPYPFDSPVRLLFFPHLPFKDKIQMGCALLYLRVSKNWKKFEQVTAHAWLEKFMGKKAYSLLWEPMLEGKFGKYYKDVPLSWFWARIYKRTPTLIYADGGFQNLCNAIAEKVIASGIPIHYNTPVLSVEQKNTLYEVLTKDTQRQFDNVFIATPPNAFLNIAKGLPEEYTNQVQGLESLGAVVAVLALKKKITDDTYWINIPKKEGFPFLAFVEHTNYMDAKHFNGNTILYCGDYLPTTHEYFSLPKDELIVKFSEGIKKINPAFDASWIVQSWVYSEKYAQPIPSLNYSTKIPAIATPLPGLYFCSMSQVYPWDRGTNYAVAYGEKVARIVQGL